MHLIPSAIALTPSFHLVRLQPPMPTTQFSLYSLQPASSMSAFAFLTFVAHSLQASMPSLERYYDLSYPHVHTTLLHSLLPS